MNTNRPDYDPNSKPKNNRIWAIILIIVLLLILIISYRNYAPTNAVDNTTAPANPTTVPATTPAAPTTAP